MISDACHYVIIQYTYFMRFLIIRTKSQSFSDFSIQLVVKIVQQLIK